MGSIYRKYALHIAHPHRFGRCFKGDAKIKLIIMIVPCLVWTKQSPSQTYDNSAKSTLKNYYNLYRYTTSQTHTNCNIRGLQDIQCRYTQNTPPPTMTMTATTNKIKDSKRNEKKHVETAYWKSVTKFQSPRWCEMSSERTTQNKMQQEARPTTNWKQHHNIQANSHGKRAIALCRS